ncbi:MAG: hypothetical protein AB8B73_04600 [Ekhidna sp.]
MKKIVISLFLLFVIISLVHSQRNADSIVTNSTPFVPEFHIEFGAGLGASRRSGYNLMVGGGFFLEPQYKIKENVVLGLELGLKGFSSIQGSTSDPISEYNLLSVLPSVQVRMDQAPYLYLGIRTGLGYVYGSNPKNEESSLKLVNSFNMGFYIWKFNIGFERLFCASFAKSGILFLKFRLR